MMKSKLIAGIFSLLLVGLVIVGPVYLSEKLEAIETSGNSNLIKSEEIISGSGEYQPYLDFNEETALRFTKAGYPGIWYDGVLVCTSGSGNEKPLVNWDSGSYGIYDSFTTGNSDGTVIYFYITVDWSQVLEDNANELLIVFNSTENWRGHALFTVAMESDGSFKGSPVELSGIMSDFTTVRSGEKGFCGTLTQEILNNAVTYSNGYDSDKQGICFIVVWTDSNGGPGDYDFSISLVPEYMEKLETTYNNSTYVPYIQSITPYSVHKVSMVAGGVLILLVGLVASPLPIGEAFDNIFPVTDNTPKRTKRRKK